MNGMKDFGQRMQDLRKLKRMTQEDLAHRVGVSGQAVSKWETNQSFPDITIIPTLAEILGTSISYLFGEEDKQSAPLQSDANFPKVYQGLPFVEMYGNKIACYSDKEVAHVDDTGVKFTDGSTAELTTKIAVNKGPGSILFLKRDQFDTNFYYADMDMSQTSKDFEFGHCSSVDLAILNCDAKIVLSQDNKTHVRAQGSPLFLHCLKVELAQADNRTVLNIGYNSINNSNNNFGQKNTLVIEIPQNLVDGVELYGLLALKIDGSGSVDCVLPLFEEGKLTVNGSGNINVKSFKNKCAIVINGSGQVDGNNAAGLLVSINGSGNVRFDSVQGDASKFSINGSGIINIADIENLATSINGSGMINADRISGGDFSVKIAGAGDIKCNGGTCNNFNVDIHGSGDIDASGVTATKANIVLHHDGKVTLGRVLDSSMEQIKQDGVITILKRGAEN